jgi:ElaB/YqjD/DUF883 family membrane-anchored ribosome-binding protein
MKKKKTAPKHHKKYQAKAKKDMATAKKRLVAAEKKVMKYIKTHPVKAATIAAGIAAAIGAAAAGTAYAVKKKKR